MKCLHCESDALEEGQERRFKCLKCGSVMVLRLFAEETTSPPPAVEKSTDPIADSTQKDEGERQRKRKGEDPDKPAKRTSFCAEDEPNPPELTEGAATALKNLNLPKEADEQQMEGLYEGSELGGYIERPNDGSIDSDRNQQEETNDHPADEEDRQRKRKGEDPDKPAKRTSFCAEDEPNSPELTEGAAAALQNLNLLREADEQQGGVPHEASEGCVKAPTDASVDSEQNQKEATNDQPSDDDNNKVVPGSSKVGDGSMDADPAPVKKGDGDAKDQSEESDAIEGSKQQGGVRSQKDGDTNDDSDENESDQEEVVSDPKKEVGLQPTSTNNKNKGRKQRKKEKKKEKKKKKEEEKRLAAQKQLQERGASKEASAQNPVKKNEKKQPTSNKQTQGQQSKNKEGNDNRTSDRGDQDNTDNTEYFSRNKKSKMTVFFHAVLAPNFKFDAQQGDRIFMRFGGPVFGDFNTDVVEVYPERYLENEFILVGAQLHLPVEYASRTLRYKYIVRKENKKDKYMWEHLEGFGVKCNRSLQIPKARRESGAVWHRYDDGIFSEQSLLQKLWNKSDHLEGRNIATRAMLPLWEGFTVGQTTTNMTAWEAITAVGDLAHCMTQTQVEDHGNWKRNVPLSYDFSALLKKFLQPKIHENASLQSAVEENKKIRRLVSSIAIAYVIHTHHVVLDREDYAKLFPSLILERDQNGKTCTAYDKLLTHFPGVNLQKLGEAIQAICRHAAKEYYSLHEWLFAVPLVHFLIQASEPFSSDVLLMEEPKRNDETWWGATGFETKCVRERSWTENRCLSSWIERFFPLFELDPLFRRTFLLVVPVHVFGKIASSGAFASVEIYTTLGKILFEKSYLMEKEWEAVANSFKMDFKTVHKMTAKEFSFPGDNVVYNQEVVLCCISCLRILRAVCNSKCSMQVLRDGLHSLESCISMLLKTAMTEQEEEEAFDKVKKFLANCFEIVNKWLKENLRREIPCYLKDAAEKELKVWTDLLSLEWTKERCEELWRGHLLEMLKMRLEVSDSNGLVEVFSKTNMAAQHKCVQDLVSEVTFQKVEGMLQTGTEREELFKNLSEYGLGSPQASKCGELLTLMLTHCWPEPQGGIPCSSKMILRQVLTWKLWPCFFQRFGRESDFRQVLNPDGQEILMKAVSSIEAAVMYLEDESITFQMLTLISDNSERFLELCGQMEQITKERSKEYLEQLLNQRIIELTAFQEERKKVGSFVRMCALITQVNVDELSRKTVVDASCLPIKDLARSTIVNGKVRPVVTFFQLSPKAKAMISELSTLCNSSLLRRFWIENGKKALSRVAQRQGHKGLLNVDDVEELVWAPSIKQLQSLQDRFMNCTISFGEIDKFFTVFSSNQDLANEFKLITSRNGNILAARESTIDTRIEQINEYYKLQTCTAAAVNILKFKDSLGLQGDFQAVKDLQNQMTKEFKQKPLTTMNAALQHAGRLLSVITPERADCLEAVAECKDLISWIRKTIKGPQELKVLVDLAIISAGEADMETYKITCLHTSCLGFAPLIFDLKPTFGFEKLMRACEPVWNAVDADPTLPEKLVATSDQLEWLKGVKKSHGSVAMSSLMEAQAINEKGVYRVGCPSEDAWTSMETLSLDAVIELTVVPDKKRFTLDNLKDLQSKLMLIAAKASHGKEDVDRFVDILQCVQRLATVYIALCKAGEVSHLRWRHEFQCTPRPSTNRSLTQDLEEQSAQMEQCLESWKKELHTKRILYNELNHFTTRQLLFLRKQLAVVQGRGPRAVDNIPLAVYNLLESVLPGVEPAILKSVLISCGICSQQTGDSIVRSYGATGAVQPSILLHQPRSKSSHEEVFQTLVAKLESIGYSETEKFAIASMISCKDASELDLFVWCVKNAGNKDLIDASYSEALRDPRYLALIDKDSTASIEEEGSSAADMMIEPEEVPEPMETTFSSDQTADGEFLSLDELGKVLRQLALQGSKKRKRRHPKYLNRGKPNLVVVPKDDILGTVLSLYMQDTSQSLPSSEEVLICSSDTTAEEIELLWRRALGDSGGQMFCLVNVDLLDYSVSQKAADSLEILLQEPQYNRNDGLSLVVICSSENEDRAHMAAALDQYRLGTIPHCAAPKDIRQYLQTQFKSCPQTQGRFQDKVIPWAPAAILDKQKLSVRVVSSERAGSGKSLVVRRLSESLLEIANNSIVTSYLRDMEADVPMCISVPIYGPTVDQCAVVESLLPHVIVPDLPLSRIFHLDVHPLVKSGLDSLLFNLLILGVLKSGSGQVWRRRLSDLYVIELTTGPTQGDNETFQRQLKTPNRVDSRKGKAEPFYRLLPTIECGTPIQTLKKLRTQEMDDSRNPLFDNAEFKSSYVQRAFQYLKFWESARENLNQFWFIPSQVMGDHAECIETLVRNCGVEDPSWAELRHFVNFLNSQLQACEESTFCNMELVGDTLEGFRSFVVQFMILMSRDFATPSLNCCDTPVEARVERDDDGADDDEEDTAVVQLSLRRHWETSSHPYIFFNQDGITMTFVGFHIDRDGNLIDPDSGDLIQPNLMSRHLRTGLFVQKVDMETNYESWGKGDKIEKLCGVMGVEWPYDPDDAYELTTDNFKKILAIHMRFRCGIPVVVMGETGCGKTCLIRYMCGLQSGPGGPKNMLLMKVHGGTSYKDIEKKVEQAETMARVNEGLNMDTVLFFDEANTTDALGMIKEVMVDRRINGRKIGVGLKRLQFIAACNPYRKHTDEMIHKLESAGLGYHVATRETQDRLGRIPLRHLVYRVHSLPESMRPLVWDFGQLKPEIEELYTRQIVSRFVLQENQIPGDELLVKALTKVLTASQRYMREQTDECSFVSLRDVERAMRVMVWFYNHRDALNPLMDENIDVDDEESEDEDEDIDEEEEYEQDDLETPIDDVSRALVLSLGVCYHARLQEREPYRRAVAPIFSHPCQLPGGHERILQEITRCQKAVLKELDLDHNIARNTALSENVFMMVVCIELRIPLFVVGKPGSSKSLAKTVVAANMEGDASKSDLFKTFKQVHMVSYQCSPLSTAEGIVATFRQCSKLQKDKNPDKFVSVVVLDEVGLAEDSPLMPLKTLHPLLEDGVSSTDDIIEVEEQIPERVAFVGISNWALDPAKMNRGIMLSRGLPDTLELVESAMGICATDKRVQNFVAPLMNPLAKGYSKLYDSQRRSEALQESKKEEFFGLRDFYSLVKMVYKIAKEHRREPRWPEIEQAIRRNFGGLDEIDPVKIFRKFFPFSRNDKKEQNKDAFSAVNLIKASLERKISGGESRYLLVLTENYAALPIVQQELHKKGEEPVVIFGSSFPKDQEYTQVCRDINRIKVCMETGRTVILLNLESLYESLYDALNQYYVYLGGQKFVDLGLGSHRFKCRVHNEFRLIVIAEKYVVYSKFPIPLINRLEKHYLVTSASLSSLQKRLVNKLQEWVTRFSDVNIPRHQQLRKYCPGDAFVGYHADTAASVVLQVTSNTEETEFSNKDFQDKVFQESKELLLQCATPDAVARLPSTHLKQQADDLWTAYFTVQKHSSLTAFLRNVLTTEGENSEKGSLVQVTTHSRLLSSNDLQDIARATSLPLPKVTCLSLQQFHTEQQFCSSVRDFFAKLGGREGLLIVQCDAGDVNRNLIPCARHLLVEQRTSAEEDFKENVGHDPSSFVHVVMIIQLPRLVGGCEAFAGFQGGRWLSVHIDELRPPTGHIPAIQFMVDRSVSDLFDVAPTTTRVDKMDVEAARDDMEVDEQRGENIDIEMEASDLASGDAIVDRVDIVSLLRSCVQAAVARIDDESWRSSRSTRRIELMLSLLPDGRSDGIDLSFATILARRIHKLLQEKDERAGDKANDWLRSEALSGTGIQENGTFRKALWQRVYSSVIPILSEVIAFVDRDSNLELVVDGGNWLSSLWLDFFQCDKMVKLDYDGFLSLESGIIRERVPVVTSGSETQSFELQFPFSWIIKERIDAMWREASSIAARSNTPIQQCLQDLVNNSSMGRFLNESWLEGYEEAAVKRYLHDFVHTMLKPLVPDEEKLLCQAIVTAARELYIESNFSEEFSLNIPFIHVAYDTVEKRLANFSQLVHAQRDIVSRLLEVIPPNEEEMVLDAVALQLCLSQLEPRADEFADPQTRLVWCNRVLAIRSSAENMLYNKSQYGPKTTRILHDCRSTWQRVSAVRLFIEHTCPGSSACHPADVGNAFKLWKALGEDTDFAKPHTMRVIEKFLVDCSEAVSKRYTSYGVNTCPVCLEGLVGRDPVKMPCSHVICLPCISEWTSQERSCPMCKQQIPEDFRIQSTKIIRKAVKEHYDFRRRCNSFFMELVSLFCFGAEDGEGVMDPELFDMFMSYVTEAASSKTKDFSPFPEHGIDATPVVRSFLLQQLLSTSDKEVKEHLSLYLTKARGLKPEIGHLLQVCQLFVHCREDSLISQYSKTSDILLVMIKLAQQLCDDCTPLLISSALRPTREIDVDVLEGVAKARYTLALTAEFMYKSTVENTEPWSDRLIKMELETLFETARRLCYKSLSPAPRLFLLKQLARRFGVEAIHVLCGRKELEWIVPPESRNKQEEDNVPDRFVIYGEEYKKIREAMAKTVLGGTNRELTDALKSVAVPNVVREVMVLLSLFREVTTCYGLTGKERRLSTKAHQCLQEFIQEGTYLSGNIQPFAAQLLDNTQGAQGIPSVRVRPGRSGLEQNLSELVIHNTTVLQSINHVTICEPLRLLMDNPVALMNAYLPTMPDDNLQEAMAGMRESGTWYQCPKGHPYYIGDCGRPVEVKVCPECKVNIGGSGYHLSRGNTTAQRADRTMTGHVLGHPSKRAKGLVPERNLSSVVVGVTRVLMHCAMIEGAIRQPQGLGALIQPTVPPAALAQFLWDHLHMDLQLLAKSLGRSVDDTVLCVHMVLVQMTALISNRQADVNVAPDMRSKDSRREWETAFSNSVVAPVLTNLEGKIQNCLGMMVGDNRLGNNPLMRQLFEVDTPSDDLSVSISPTCPALWRYRTQVTLDHLSHTFQQEVASTDPERNKVLAEFLRQEHNLRALRFLPDIIKLQRLLMEKFHRRIDRAEAEHITIRNFLKKIPSKTSKDELTSLIMSFNNAWNHVRLSLDQQGRLRPPSDLCEMSMDNSRPLAVLLPSTSGLGICSTALVFFLTMLHNEFNERYQNLTGGEVKDLPHIQLQDVTTSQLIAYDTERDLLPLILAQCNYSLEVGRGTLVQYNWDALERQLIDRFIRRKPLVDFKDERFAFSQDIQLDSVFAAVKAKVTQVPLSSAVSRQVISEFRSLTDICDVLSSLDIAIGFLSSTGGAPERLLSDYLGRVLRMQQNTLRSLKAQQYCQLRHVISLWRLLTLERAKILIRRGEDPFEQISDTYKQVMSRGQMIKFSNGMRRIDLDCFVCEVLELILLNLRGDAVPGEEEMSLGDYIEWHLDNKGHEPVPGLDALPSEVQLKHVINAWRTSVELCDNYHDKRDAANA